MRLFILERTPLADAHRLAEPPRSGDVVAFLRRGQDVDGEATERLQRAGIAVVDAQTLIDPAAAREVEDAGRAFIDGWFLDGGRDVSLIGPLSLGRISTHDICAQTNPRFQIITGETVRRLIAAYPAAEQVLCDMANGEGPIRVDPSFQPLAGVARLVAEALGRPFRTLDAVDPLPPLSEHPGRLSLLHAFKVYVGGWRPAWLRERLARRRRRLARAGRPALYVFDCRGATEIVRPLLRRGKVAVIASAPGHDGAEAMRSDHLFAVPGLRDMAAARRLLRHVSILARQGSGTGRCIVGGIDYEPMLAAAIHAVLRRQIIHALLVIAQTRRLQRLAGFSAVLINGEGKSPMGVLVGLNRHTGLKIYFVRHGMNNHRVNVATRAYNNPHVTYVANGEDHRAEYGVHLAAGEKPVTPPLGNPLTALMNPIRGRRAAVHARRLLLLSFTPLAYYNAVRTRACDLYLVQVLAVARMLIDEGWTISLRGHPGDPLALERRMVRAMGLEGRVVIDAHPSLDAALLDHDAVVSNFSSSFYQSLYAGWPTVFFEPDYLGRGDAKALFTDEFTVGLVHAHDIERPVTTDPARLLQLVRETLDPDSPTSRFPRRFTGELAPRFLGPRPDASGEVIAEFIEADLLGAGDGRVTTDRNRAAVRCGVSAGTAVSRAAG